MDSLPGERDLVYGGRVGNLSVCATDPIVVAGTGTLGMALARLFARSGRDVVLASRDLTRARRAARSVDSVSRAGGGRVEGAPLAGAARRGGILALATRWENTREAVETAGPFEGTVLLDATNPEALDGRTLAVGHTTSGAEAIAAWAPGARVVKAFNHTYAELLDAGPAFPGSGAAPAVLYCGDDSEAKERVARLVSSCGFAPVDAGPLTSARYLEPVAALFVELVRGRGRAPADVALGILTRPSDWRDPKGAGHVESVRSVADSRE
jgi:8-hydroxy-5-deazaflavin:NADPH oxidoreductase